MSDSIERLYAALAQAGTRDPAVSRTAKLLRSGVSKMAKKLAEEAVEVGLEAVQGRQAEVVRESADLIYNLAVLWHATGVTPAEVWAEMGRRERLYGLAEKLAKKDTPEPKRAALQVVRRAGR